MVHHTYTSPDIIRAQNNFIWTTYIMLPAQLFDLLMLDHFSCSYFTEGSNSEKTIPTSYNSHQQFTTVFQHLYHGLSPFL